MIFSGTFLSRLLGFVRDVLIARFFGTGPALEAFLVAFKLPNFFRFLMGEGASDSVIVPVLSEYRDKKELYLIGRKVISFSLLILSIITVGGIVFSRFIITITAPGFISDPFKFHLSVIITKIVFPYLIFMGISANMGALFSVKNRFFVPSFSPIILNLVLIIAIFLSGYYFNKSIFIIAIAVLAAGFLQFLWYGINISREKEFKFGFDFRPDRALTKMFKLSLPRILSAAIYNLNVLVDTILASFSFIVGTGAIAAIYYSQRIIQTAVAIFTLSISRAAIPKLSYAAAHNDINDFKHILSFAFEILALIIIPLSGFIFLFSSLIIEVIFKRGSFGEYSVMITASTLSFYSLGLFFFSINILMIRAFYSLQDTFTVAKVSLKSFLINLVLNITLMFPLKVGGLALASSLAAALTSFMLQRRLREKIGAVDSGLLREILKIILASILMLIISFSLRSCLNFSHHFVALIFFLIVGFCSFVIWGWILNIKTLRRLLLWLNSKNR